MALSLEIGQLRIPIKLSDMKSDQFSLQSRLRSFSYAGAGIFSFLKKEHNAWLHLIATVAVIVLGVITKLSAWEWISVLVAIGLVWVAEMFNTCFERLTDFISPGQHPQIKLIKDMAAGAVLIAAVISLIIGLIIFIPHLLAW